MNFQFLAFFILLLITILNTDGIFAENGKFTLENSRSIEEQRSTYVSKIHPILSQWQLSENPNKFAKENNLSYSENNIGIYIYLDNADSFSKIPSEIDVTGKNEKIVYAFVSSEQLDELNNFDFIEKIAPPDLARVPPLPQIEIPETQMVEENQYDYLLWIAIGGIVIITIGILKKMKRFQ